MQLHVRSVCLASHDVVHLKMTILLLVFMLSKKFITTTMKIEWFHKDFSGKYFSRYIFVDFISCIFTNISSLVKNVYGFELVTLRL